MTDGFQFKRIATDGAARRGQISTPHGTIETPAFMPVGTVASVKAMMPSQVEQTGAEIILGNTYHLMLRPGPERLEKFGGMHGFMGWNRPILTDSGGYQVMSLGALRSITEKGVVFRSHLDGSKHDLSPEKAVDVQRAIGSDIQMVLDECTPYPATHAEAQSSMELSMRWAARARVHFLADERLKGRAQFGIVQGGVYDDLRKASIDQLTDTGFEGYAIGGLAVGEGQELMFRVLDGMMPHMPQNNPRYLMGVGKPDDLVGAVLRGCDMFDCVLPTRSGRHGQAFTWDGPVNLKNARYAEDLEPLDATSDCPASTEYSKAYLHHLVRAGEMLSSILLTWHNIAFYQALMRGLRFAVERHEIDSFASAFLSRYRASGEKVS